MAAIIIKIFSILGIILLSVLGVAILAIMLVLFVPVHYRTMGQKKEKDVAFSFKASWLFRLLQVCFTYPESGQLSVRLLGISLCQKNLFSKESSEKFSDNSSEQQEKTTSGKKEKSAAAKAKQTKKKTEDNTEKSEDHIVPPHNRDSEENSIDNKKVSSDSTEKDPTTEPADHATSKIQKVVEKIKKIIDEFDFYKMLLQDEETKALFAHAFRRLGLLLRHIRPRKIKADILFGTGSPDTTGYAYGIYGMLMPHLGKNVYVTPDFTQQILQGEFYLKGHITVFTVLINCLKLLLDKKLRIFMQRIKKHQKENKS